MDYAACNVVYVDRTAREDRLVKREDAISAASLIDAQNHAPGHHAPDALGANLRTLLGTFSEVHVCTSGKSCASKLSELNQASIVELIPTLVLIDIPYEDQLDRPSRELRTPSPNSKLQVDGHVEEPVRHEAYGLELLQWIASEIQYQSLSKLIVPVAVIAVPEDTPAPTPRGRPSSRADLAQFSSFVSGPRHSGLVTPLDQVKTMRYLDVGAVDVLTSPLLQERLPSLGIHAYRAHKDASKDHRAILDMKRGRKRSWVGVDDQKPYAYLREAMVSGLMDGICKVGGEEEPFSHVRISVALDRREKIVNAVAAWDFSAHDFTDDELLHAALLMLQHALTMPELERWRISTENLTGFLVASRSAYNAFVPYHNFRHVVDVLQASFHFLVRLGRLPVYPYSSSTSPTQTPTPSPIAELIRPFDALTLLITAIGHDVGHPGVNNAFLVTLNAPLAQLYNDRSVLESFHCAAYSQILRRHWPAAFSHVPMRQLMINSILATDMGLHFDYMKKLGFLQEKLHENGGTDGWNGRLLEEERTLACGLLIKCADISNVARKYEVAAKWTMILTDEFARQASMEKDLGIPSALFAAPVRETVELGKSQIGFMNMFAIPLFQGVTDVMPGMGFAVEELQRNKSGWELRIKEEQERARQDNADSINLGMMDGMFSPRTMSVATPSDASHQKIGSPMASLSTLGSETDLRIRALLKNKSPFTFPLANGIFNEADEDASHQSLPMLSTKSLPAEDSAHPSPSELTPEADSRRPSKPSESNPDSSSRRSSKAGEGNSESSSRRSSKPSQLQLSYATSSAPGLLDHPSLDKAFANVNGERQTNGVEVQPSLVTEAVTVEPIPESTSPKEPRKTHSTTDKQRSSDTTESSNSATGDWASQVTSATTGKMPLSPSTQGTSIISENSVEKDSAGLTPTCASPLVSAESKTSIATESVEDGSHSSTPPESKGAVLMETVRNLRKKPSRFRMNSLNFWKRSKSASPPMPNRERSGGPVGGSEDEALTTGNQRSFS